VLKSKMLIRRRILVQMHYCCIFYARYLMDRQLARIAIPCGDPAARHDSLLLRHFLL
jgi:hypothetical protein